MHFLFYEHVEELAEAIAELEKTTPTPTPTPPAPKEPGFEEAFAIAGVFSSCMCIRGAQKEQEQVMRAITKPL